MTLTVLFKPCLMSGFCFANVVEFLKTAPEPASQELPLCLRCSCLRDMPRCFSRRLDLEMLCPALGEHRRTHRPISVSSESPRFPTMMMPLSFIR